MIGKVSTKYAFRSLMRHPRRTFLSVVGVGIGCAIGMIAIAYYSGAAEMQIRAASESGAGHLRVVHEDWPEVREHSLRLADWRADMDAIESIEGVRSAAARARINALLAFGNRTAGVEMVGVVPDDERASSRIVSKSDIEGRYLAGSDRGRVVIGRALARRLDVELEDDLMVTVSGREEMSSAMLRIVGILDVDSMELELGICHVTLDDLNRITGYDAPGEISILLEDHGAIDAARELLLSKTADGDTVITWKEVNRAIAANVEGDTAFIRLLSLIIIIVVVLGATSAQLTGVLERRREFGMLTALGMKPRQVVGVIILEAVFTAVGAAAVALLIGAPVSYLIATKGIDISSYMGGELSFGGVLFDPIIYGDFDIWIAWYAMGVSLAASVCAALYPAWFAARTQPAEAMRVV